MKNTSLVLRKLGRTTLAGLSGIGLAVMTGCGIGPSAGPSSTVLPAIQGKIHGGQIPIQNATVTLYHTNPLAVSYGAAGIVVGTATTDVNGNFSIAPSATAANCPAGTQAYLTAAGGYQTGQPALVNTSVLLMAALGDCSTISSSTFVLVDEVTTVAAAYALSGFLTTSLNSGSGLYVANVSAPAAASVTAANITPTTPAGLVHAFQNAALLADYSTGNARATVSANIGGGTVSGSVPYVELLTLADIMESCVNGVTGNAKCVSLFGFTPSITGVAPANTLQAFVNLARNPYPSAAAMSASTGLLSLVTGMSAFQPTLTAAPADWSVSIVYGKGTLNPPYFFALDANDTVYFDPTGTSAATPALYALSTYGTTVPTFTPPSVVSSAANERMIAPDALGNVWVPNNGFVTDRFSATSGSVLSSYTSTVGSTASVAIDRANNVWLGHVASGTGINLEGLVYNPATTSWALGYTAAPGANTGSYGVTIDGNQNIWSAGYYNGGSSVVLIANTGTALTPVYAGTTTSGVTALSSYAGTVGAKPYSVVIDPSGNAWAAITGSNTTATTGIQQLVPSGLLNATSFTAQPQIFGTTAGSNGNVLGTAATQEMAIDGAGTIFIPDNNSNTLGIHMYSTVTSNTLTPPTGLKSCYLATTSTTTCGLTSSAAIYNPRQPVVDSTGSVWAGITTGGVTQIIGVAAPSYPLLQVGRPSQSPGLTGTNPLP